MKAAQINKYGGPEVIEINEVDKPTPKAGQVLVEVHAAAINPFDWKVRSGAYQKMIPIKFPMTVGADFSGVITQLGKGVTEFSVGDEVFGTAITLSGGSGAVAEYTVANSDNTALKPANTNFEEAAALVLVGISAFQALDKLNLQTGQKLLIHGGAGGIGSTAIQYAKHLGAYVATTVRSDDTEFVKQLGADEVIDYEKQVFENELKDYDAVFDTVGGDAYSKSFKVLKKGGILISMVEQRSEELASRCGVKALMQNSEEKTKDLLRLKKLAEDGVIKPQIDKKFPLEQTAEAFKHLETGHPQGKVVITIR